MSFESIAEELAFSIRAVECGFITMNRDELRNRFGVSRLTENIADSIYNALEKQDIIAYPHPFSQSWSLRFYDLRHDIGKVMLAILAPDRTTDAPLKRAVELSSKDQALKDLRSDDVPWIEAFGMMLQTLLGREPDGWEDLHYDRHQQSLSFDLANALGIKTDLLHLQQVKRLASVAGSYRPVARDFHEDDICIPHAPEQIVSETLAAIEHYEKRAQEERIEVLRAFAKLLLNSQEVPQRQVEVGVLGLRRRRDGEL